MAADFKISVHRSGENLHLRLERDFDGGSADMVCSYLKRNLCRSSRVFIHTNCLNTISPFGRDLFRKRLNATENPLISYIFTGENASALAPVPDNSFQVI